jgi:hypothetical protein
MDLLSLERGVRHVSLEDYPVALFVAQLIDLLVLRKEEEGFFGN